MNPRFQLGSAYSRKGDIHRRFKGQQQGGIITPRGVPAIFLVTGKSGKQHGYEDGRLDDGSFRYFGEGQSGDMKFVRGNRAVRANKVPESPHHRGFSNGRGRVRTCGLSRVKRALSR